MSKRSRARTAGAATGSAVSLGGGAAGSAAQRAGSALQRAGAVLEERSVTAAPVVAAGISAGLDRAAEALGTAADRVGETVGSVSGGSLAGLLEEPAVRGGAALDALRGVPVGPPAAVRRWPWAVGAAALGALAGMGVALLVRRVQGEDAPDAQEPHELRAVVDLPVDGPAGAVGQDAGPQAADDPAAAASPPA